ncbi:MAG: hypothetical protein KC502_23130, partial [Myxococcales bacterium]|nr:hypothetical protein [Myxococcales bacterium]
MTATPPMIVLHHPGGREEQLERRVLLARIASHGISGDATVSDGGPQLPLSTWYLDNSEIHALPDPEDTAYVQAHVCGELDTLSLRRELGFADDADRIDVGEGGRSFMGPISMPSCGRASGRGQAGGDDEDAIVVPPWGSAYELTSDLEIAIPDWQDPATAVFDVPVLYSQSWERAASDAGAGTRKKPEKSAQSDRRRAGRSAPKAARHAPSRPKPPPRQQSAKERMRSHVAEKSPTTAASRSRAVPSRTG